MLGNHLSVGIVYLHLGRNFVHFVEAGNLGLNLHLAVVFCAYEERMAREVELLIGDDEVDVAIESAAGVPS